MNHIPSETNRVVQLSKNVLVNSFNNVFLNKFYKCVDHCNKMMFCRIDYLREHLIRVHTRNKTRTEATACVHKLQYTEIQRTDFVINRS